MNERYYRVLCDGLVIAEHMTLELALLLIQAMFEKFWEDPASYTIEEMEDAR